MRKTPVAIWFVIAALLVGVSAYAVTAPEATPGKPAVAAKKAAKKQPPRETRMRATGTVVSLDAETLRIERNVTAEIMDFCLEKPLDKIGVGDKVTVSYVKSGGNNVAKRVGKVPPPKKKIAPKLPAAKPATPTAK